MANGYSGAAETFEVGKHTGYSSAPHPVNAEGKVFIGKVKGMETKAKGKAKGKEVKK